MSDSVANILEWTAQATMQDWYERVLVDKDLMAIPLTREQRCAHLPRLFRGLLLRLRSHTVRSSQGSSLDHAAEYGAARRQWGYSAAMIVTESRMLEISIFKSLHENRRSLDFHELMADVISIADEINAQLSCAVASPHRSYGTRLRLHPTHLLN